MTGRRRRKPEQCGLADHTSTWRCSFLTFRSLLGLTWPTGAFPSASCIRPGALSVACSQKAKKAAVSIVNNGKKKKKSLKGLPRLLDKVGQCLLFLFFFLNMGFSSLCYICIYAICFLYFPSYYRDQLERWIPKHGCLSQDLSKCRACPAIPSLAFPGKTRRFIPDASLLSLLYKINLYMKF